MSRWQSRTGRMTRWSDARGGTGTLRSGRCPRSSHPCSWLGSTRRCRGSGTIHSSRENSSNRAGFSGLQPERTRPQLRMHPHELRDTHVHQDLRRALRKRRCRSGKSHLAWRSTRRSPGCGTDRDCRSSTQRTRSQHLHTTPSGSICTSCAELPHLAAPAACRVPCRQDRSRRSWRRSRLHSPRSGTARRFLQNRADTLRVASRVRET